LSGGRHETFPSTGVFYSAAYFFPSSLLKTFSMNLFQGQCLNIAVRMNTTPINPTTQCKAPSMKKVQMIKTTPIMNRKTASDVVTFFVLIVGSMFPSLDYPLEGILRRILAAQSNSTLP
jgi:hypothetical protein